MTALVFVPFAVFIACCLAQFFFMRRLRVALVDRHPQIWSEISRKAHYIDSAVMNFASSRECRKISDPEVATAAMRLRVLKWVAIGSWLAMAGLIAFGGRS